MNPRRSDARPMRMQAEATAADELWTGFLKLRNVRSMLGSVDVDLEDLAMRRALVASVDRVLEHVRAAGIDP
jgi:hypothetical protein